MPDMGQFAQALQGFGAGLTGQGVQWQNSQTLDREQKSRDQELLRKEREKAFYTDVLVARQMAATGDFAGANKLMQSRQEHMSRLGPMDGNSEHTDIMAGLAKIAADPTHPKSAEAQQRLIGTLDNYVGIGAATGVLGGGKTGYNSTASNQMFKDGSVLQANRDGTTTFRDPSGQLLEGQARMEALNRAIGSGVWLAGQEAGARATATEAAQTAAVGPQAYNAALGQQQGQAGAPGILSAAELAAAEAKAKAAAAADVVRDTQGRINASAGDTLDAAAQQVLTAFSKVNTGPLMGRVPAVMRDSTAYQTAEGAAGQYRAQMRKVIRPPGSGPWTDTDEEKLSEIVPKLTDTPEAVAAKIQQGRQLYDAMMGNSQGGASQAPAAPAAIKFLGFE